MSLDQGTTSATGSFVTPLPPRHFTVLVVDHDPTSADQISQALKAPGVRILRAATGMQGYWLAISKTPDAIITELGMANGGGADMLECLKDSPETRGIPVIVNTSQNYPGMRHHLERLGAAAVIDKAEQRVADLLQLVETLLASAP
ncbi:MAG: response regulator [Planctomycetaceae bacterium]|nr:response regulator [Planctomycetales bacterium]MCB9923282.1 response regulator [Planctomycetaceae bacterium]